MGRGPHLSECALSERRLNLVLSCESCLNGGVHGFQSFLAEVWLHDNCLSIVGVVLPGYCEGQGIMLAEGGC